MAQSFTYTIFARDAASKTLFKIASNSNTAFSKMRSNTGKWLKQNDRIGNNINGLKSKLQTFEQKRNESFSTREIIKFNKSIRKTQKELKRLESLPRPSFVARIKNISGAMGGILPVAGGVGVALGAWNGIKGVLKLGADMEQTRVSFTTMLGSASAANKMINDLDQFANATPFQNVDIQKNARLLLNFGISGQKILPTLRKIGDVSGGNKQRLDSLSLAYAQVSSAGKLTGQDLLQMINAGFNPLQVISEKTGKSMADLKTAMSEGAISAKMVEEAFTIVTSEGGRFYQMMEKQSKTVAGKLSTLQGKLSLVGIALGEKLLPYASQFLDWGLKAVEFLPKIPAYFNAITGAVRENGTVLGLLGIAVLGLTSNFWIAKASSVAFTTVTKVQVAWTKIATAGQWLWNAAMTANPIGLIIAGVAALGAGVVWAYKKVGWFRGGIMASWEALKGFGTIIKQFVIDRIKGMISGITGIGKTLLLFFKGEWKQAWETGKQAASDLVGLDAAKNAVGKFKDVGKNVANAYMKGVHEVRDNKRKKSLFDTVSQSKQNSTFGDGLDSNTTKDENTKGSGLSDGINSINGGGKKQTNINVTFDKLIEELVIKSQTVEMGIDDMQEEVSRAVVRVLNSFTQLKPS